MRAGQLRHRIVLQQLGTRADDGVGGGSIPFTDVATVWAAVEPLAGNELFTEQQFNPSVTHRVRIRYYAGVKPSWRVKYGARMLDIKAPRDLDERHREMDLICEELLSW